MTNQTSETRAKAGGQMGINGEFYEGGQFLPSSKDTVKGAQAKIKAGHKSPIAPFVWIASPAPDMLSIYARIENNVTDNRRDCEYVKGVGFIGLQVKPAEKMLDGNGKPQRQEWVDFITALCQKFNAGERWFPLADDPFHYLNQK